MLLASEGVSPDNVKSICEGNSFITAAVAGHCPVIRNFATQAANLGYPWERIHLILTNDCLIRVISAGGRSADVLAVLSKLVAMDVPVNTLHKALSNSLLAKIDSGEVADVLDFLNF